MKTSYPDFSEIIHGHFDARLGMNHELIETWTSMQSLIVVSVIDQHFNVLIGYEELKKCQTLADLYELLVKKLN